MARKEGDIEMMSAEQLASWRARVAKWQDDSGAWHDVVFSAAAGEIRALLEHIEAQEEALQEYRETLASQYAAIVEDNDLHQQLETAQAEAAAMRQELDRLDTRFFWCPECGREAPEVHVDDCALARSLSGTAGQALLDELERLRVEAARLQRLIDEHDARVMQPGGVPYEYPVQLAAEAAGMMVALTTIDGAIKRGEHHGSVWQLIADIENAIEPTRKTTVGQAVLDELTGLRAVAKAAVVFEQAVNRGWNYSVTGSDMCDAGGELLLCLAACGYGDALLVERVQAGEAAGYLREEKSNARTTE